MSLKEQIQQAGKNLEIEPVNEWDGIHVRGLSWKEYRDVVHTCSRKDRNGNVVRDKNGSPDVDGEKLTIKMILAAVCEEDGSRVFDDDDVHIIESQTMRSIQNVSSVAMRLSGVDLGESGGEGNAEAGSVEKSDKTPSEDFF